MTDYVIVELDGELTEGYGYPHGEVGCHGVAGQMLWDTRRYVNGDPFVLRLVACDCALVMPEMHPENPVALAVLTGLGYPHRIRGRIAIVRCDWQNEQVPLTPGDLSHLRNLAAAGRAVGTLRTQNPQLRAFVADVDEGGQLRLDEIPSSNPGESQ